jgi:pilus assembly protein CpaE
MTAPANIAAVEALGPRRIAISADPGTLAAIAAATSGLGWPAPETLGSIAAAVAAIGHGSPPALLIIDLDDEAEPLAALASLANVCLAETCVLAIGRTNDIALFRSLIDAGVGDYLVKPLQPRTLAEALHGLTTADAAPAALDHGRSIAVIGARGGCGATTIATSLAWSITADDRDDRCILVDFDLHYGTAAMTLATQPGTALAAMLASPDRLDEQMIAASLHPATDRLGVIAAQTPVEQDATIAPAAAVALVAALRSAAQWVVADLPRTLDATARQLLRTADTVILVSPPSLEGVRDTGRLLAYLLALRAGAAPIIVVNGVAGSDAEIDRHLFETTIGAPVAAWIPALWDAAAAAAANARPLAAFAETKAGNPFAALAEAVTGRTPPRPPRRWWRR